ncbi:MAG: hypothetical protein IPK44_16815 [Candidatus Accumulibacter sp.]|uniref:hypothetical protein n=1 Tax=Accumulibacter sp. TaxID=2053492 RepID=UPI0025890F88|nr:hypothetical protein [Accumulibacter sp.]MBK8116033.1 hypothetical protein [Accumulibacter sp.]
METFERMALSNSGGDPLLGNSSSFRSEWGYEASALPAPPGSPVSSSRRLVLAHGDGGDFADLLAALIPGARSRQA